MNSARGLPLLTVLLLLPAPASATVIDVAGHQSGTFAFTQTRTYVTSGTYTQHRVALPTAYTINDESNIFFPQGWSVEVTTPTGGPVQGAVFNYNEGELNSGAWIQVVNPAPGQPFTYRIRIVVEAFNALGFFGLRGDVDRFLHASVSYTYPSAYCDSYHPAIQSALNAALADGRWAAGTHPGVRGDLERIALQVNELSYRSPAIATSPRTASQVWNAQDGDCDDLVKLQCSMQRLAGIPSRCVLSGAIPHVSGDIGEFGEAVQHAFGEYWNGASWESYEPGVSENFATTAQVVLGVDEDFENIVNAVAAPPLGYPTTLVSSVVQGAIYHSDGGWSERGRRWIGSEKELYSQLVSPAPPRSPAGPHDVLGVIGSGVGVEDAGAPPTGRFGLRALRQPARGEIRLALDLSFAGTVRGAVFDLSGRQMFTVTPLFLSAGSHTIILPIPSPRCGVYFVRLTEGSRTGSARVVCLSL